MWRSSTMFSTLSTYDVNHTAIAFLSNMIENANGSDVSAVRDELIQLLDQQIELVEAIHEDIWEEAQEYTDIIWECEAKVNLDDPEGNFKNIPVR